MSYNHISPKRYIIVAAADFCMSFDRRYAENPEADTIAPLDFSLSYPRESFATITRCKRYCHAELYVVGGGVEEIGARWCKCRRNEVHASAVEEFANVVALI